MVDRFLVWLGASVVTAGVSAALLAGAGVAMATDGESSDGGDTTTSESSDSTGSQTNSGVGQPPSTGPNVKDEDEQADDLAGNQLDDAEDEDAKDEDAKDDDVTDEDAKDDDVTDEDAKDEDVTDEDVTDNDEEAVELADTADGTESGTGSRSYDAQLDDPQTLELNPTVVDDLGPEAKIADEDIEKKAGAVITEPEAADERALVTLATEFEEVVERDGRPRIRGSGVRIPRNGGGQRHGHRDTVEHLARRDRDDRLRSVRPRHPGDRRPADPAGEQHGDGASVRGCGSTAVANRAPERVCPSTGTSPKTQSRTGSSTCSTGSWRALRGTATPRRRWPRRPRASSSHPRSPRTSWHSTSAGSVGRRCIEAMADLFDEDNTALAESALEAGYDGPIPNRVVLMGHSLGGGAVSGIAGYMSDPVYGAPDRLAGVVLLDGVGLNGEMANDLRKVDEDIPIYQLAAPEYFWNMFGSGTDALHEARPDKFIGVTLVGGSHVDTMRGGNFLIQFSQQLVSGFSTPQNVEAARIVMVGWVNDMFDPSGEEGIYLERGETRTIDTPMGAGHRG